MAKIKLPEPTTFPEKLRPAYQLNTGLAGSFHLLEVAEMKKLQKASAAAVERIRPGAFTRLLAKVDYTPLIPFVRHQGAFACGMNAFAACWDIMNEMINPYSPNMSVNRQIWAWSRTLPGEFIRNAYVGKWQEQTIEEVVKAAGAVIPGPEGKVFKTLDEYLVNMGCPTEGTELTDSNAVKWPTAAGTAEAPNYKPVLTNSIETPYKVLRMAVKVDVNILKYYLAKQPLRIAVMNNQHFVALIGYDDTKQRFKFINSWGDRWVDPVYDAKDGYGYIPYDKLTQLVQGAELFNIAPPKAEPTVRISFKSDFRQGIYLWLGVEGKPGLKRIWPSEQHEDDSRNLTLTVTMPSGFTWPPSQSNRLFLEAFHCGQRSAVPAQLVEFTAAFQGQLIKCNALSQSALTLLPHQVVRQYLI